MDPHDATDDHGQIVDVDERRRRSVVPSPGRCGHDRFRTRARGGERHRVRVGAWGALSRAPHLWGRAVIINIPPFEIFGENLSTYPQIKKSFYFWYFQMQLVIEDRIRQDDFAFIRDIWGDWSPGYSADEDLAHIREALAQPEHLHAALGYYWGQFDPTRFGPPEWAAEQGAAWGGAVPQPTLYLHGTSDGCHGVSQEQVERVPGFAGPGSDSALIEGVGHFMLVERPREINDRILAWLAATKK